MPPFSLPSGRFFPGMASTRDSMKENPQAVPPRAPQLHRVGEHRQYLSHIVSACAWTVGRVLNTASAITGDTTVSSLTKKESDRGAGSR